MGVTVQVRDLDADVQQTLRDAAAREGLSLSAFLRRELTELADRLAVRERAERLGIKQNRFGVDPSFFAGIDVVALIREDRER